jgi:GYF domain 2
MYKIIGADQKEYGPSSADEIKQWVAEGRANGATLVQAEGSGEWKRLDSFPEFAGLTFRTPSFEPAAPPHAEAAGDFNVASCLSRSWKLLFQNFGLLVGATFIVWLVDSVISLFPLIGPIIHLLIYGVLFGGLYMVYLKRIRGEEAAVGDAFMGFKKSATQLMLVGLISTFLTQLAFLFCTLPGIYLIVAWIFCIPLVIDRGMEFWSAMELSRQVVTRVWFKVCLLLFIAFLPFVLFNVYTMVEAFKIIYSLMQSGSFTFEKLEPFFKTAMIWGLIGKVILLFNYPFALGAVLYAYEDLFGTRKSPKP